MERETKAWPPLLNFKELCEYLGKSEAVTRRIVANHKEFAKDKFYSLAIIERWLGTSDFSSDDDDCSGDDYYYSVSSVDKEADQIIAQVMGFKE